MVQSIDGVFVDVVLYQATNRPSFIEKQQIIDFILLNSNNSDLEENHVLKSIEYATKECQSFGGFVILQKMDGKIVSAAILNQTGMEGYLPENLVVFVAFDNKHKTTELESNLFNYILRHAKGEVAIKVSVDEEYKTLNGKKNLGQWISLR